MEGEKGRWVEREEEMAVKARRLKARRGRKKVERGLFYIVVVLRFKEHQNKMQGFLKHRLMGSAPRVLNVDHLGMGEGAQHVSLHFFSLSFFLR